MPRTAREESPTGIYHVMTRGLDRTLIFEDDEDYRMFLFFLEDCRTACGFELLAYCLMSNHVHLMLYFHDDRDNLETVMKKLGTRYAGWFNRKYGRLGPLFQGRYKSEPVPDRGYFAILIRYIHRNPVKAKICPDMGAYSWSSYQDYFGTKSPLCPADTALALRINPIEWWRAFHLEYADDKCLDADDDERKISDAKAKDIIKTISGCATAAEFSQLPKEQRDAALAKLGTAGLAQRQTSRLTGVSIGVIRRVFKTDAHN